MNMEFMDEYYERMRADDIEELSRCKNDEYDDCLEAYRAAKDALIEGLGLSHLFNHSTKLSKEEHRIWLLFDKVAVTQLIARDALAKGAYMVGAEDRERMLK